MSNIEFDDWRPMTEAEAVATYGERVVPTGKYFKKSIGYGEHYYYQRDLDAVHVLKGELINTLYANALNQEQSSLEEIKEEEFEAAIRETIYTLELYKYWKA